MLVVIIRCSTIPAQCLTQQQQTNEGEQMPCVHVKEAMCFHVDDKILHQFAVTPQATTLKRTIPSARQTQALTMMSSGQI